MSSKTTKRKPLANPPAGPGSAAPAAAGGAMPLERTVPGGGAAGSMPDDVTIRQRAYELWQRAGSPEHRAGEFWLEAERQLREER